MKDEGDIILYVIGMAFVLLIALGSCESKRDVPIDDTKKEVSREAPKGRN